MTILSQVLLGFAAIALLIFSVRLIFTLLLRLQLLPVLIWLCVGRVYPQCGRQHTHLCSMGCCLCSARLRCPAGCVRW